MKTLKIPASATSIRVWFTIVTGASDEYPLNIPFGYRGESLEDICRRQFEQECVLDYDVSEEGWSIRVYDIYEQQLAFVNAIMFTDIFQNERYLDIELEEVEEPEEDWEGDWDDHPDVFRTDGTVDFYFLSPETVENPERSPKNWLFSDAKQLADAVEVYAQNPPSLEQLNECEAWADEVRGFIVASINQNLPKGFEIITEGWVAHVNPERIKVNAEGARSVAAVGQWYAVTLTPVMDYAADIIRKHSPQD